MKRNKYKSEKELCDICYSNGWSKTLYSMKMCSVCGNEIKNNINPNQEEKIYDITTDCYKKELGGYIK